VAAGLVLGRLLAAVVPCHVVIAWCFEYMGSGL
jgi:hypothetical protein